MYKNYFKEKQSRKANVKINIRSSTTKRIENVAISDEDEEDNAGKEDNAENQTITDKENTLQNAPIPNFSSSPVKLKYNVDVAKQSPITTPSKPSSGTKPSINGSSLSIESKVQTAVPFTQSIIAENISISKTNNTMTPQRGKDGDSSTAHPACELFPINDNSENNVIEEAKENLWQNPSVDADFQAMLVDEADLGDTDVAEADEEILISSENLVAIRPSPISFDSVPSHAIKHHPQPIYYHAAIFLGVILILSIFYPRPNSEVHVISFTKSSRPNPYIRITSRIIDDFSIYKLFSGNANGKIIETKFEFDDSANESTLKRTLHHPSRLLGQKQRQCVCDLMRSRCQGLLEPSDLSLTLNLTPANTEVATYRYGSELSRAPDMCSACGEMKDSSRACYYYWPEKNLPRQLTAR
jgi:hypothetical protein